MSERYFIYCRKDGEQLNPFMYTDSFGSYHIEDTLSDENKPYYPNCDSLDSDVVIKTFKDNSDYYDPLLDAMMNGNWEIIADWVDRLDTARTIVRTPCQLCGRSDPIDFAVR